MSFRYKIVKDNSIKFIIKDRNYNEKEALIKTGQVFNYTFINKKTLEEQKSKGIITAILDDEKVIIDLSTRYRSDVRTVTINTFFSCYLNQDGYSIDIARLDACPIIKSDNYCILDRIDGSVIREGTIVTNKKTNDTGKFFDFKINRDRLSISYKLDCSLKSYSNILEFEDDCCYQTINGEMMIRDMNLKIATGD